MKDRHKLGRMNVQRIEADGVGRLEPPLDDRWTLFDQLRWWAGVVHADTGLDINVKPSDFRVNGVPIEGYADIILPGASSIGPCVFSVAKATMDGISIGYFAAKREVLGD